LRPSIWMSVLLVTSIVREKMPNGPAETCTIPAAGSTFFTEPSTVPALLRSAPGVLSAGVRAEGVRSAGEPGGVDGDGCTEGAPAGGGAGCVVWARVWEPTREEVLERILPSSVQIIVEQQEGRRVRTGSGVVLTSQRVPERAGCFVLTSGHTLSGLAGQKEVYVVLGRHRGDGKKTRATLVAHRDSTDLDLALLKAETEQCVPARPGGAPLLGESVWVVGFPWGRSMTLASGVVSQIRLDDSPEPDPGSRLMVDASVSYGSSGGGVYEARDGRLIGIVAGYSTARVSSKGADPPWYIEVPVPGQTYVTSMADVLRFLTAVGYANLVDAKAAPPPGPVETRAR